ncbi:hypothetical protein K440DRAFT_641850 [Wilcoxina mikolae CBS 423.85]|nr:hypothetical protein K440DRAFT_641850 [Wilcoxina mikolae CBS 423.85]
MTIDVSNILTIMFGIIASLLAAVGAAPGFKYLVKYMRKVPTTLHTPLLCNPATTATTANTTRKRQSHRTEDTELLPASTTIQHGAHGTRQPQTTPSGSQLYFASLFQAATMDLDNSMDIHSQAEMGIFVRLNRRARAGDSEVVINAAG